MIVASGSAVRPKNNFVTTFKLLEFPFCSAGMLRAACPSADCLKRYPTASPQVQIKNFLHSSYQHLLLTTSISPHYTIFLLLYYYFGRTSEAQSGKIMSEMETRSSLGRLFGMGRPLLSGFLIGVTGNYACRARPSFAQTAVLTLSSSLTR